MNIERIVRHRLVLLAALTCYEKRIEKLNKDEGDLEVDSRDSKRILSVIEELRGEFEVQTTMGIEGTPMGDALSAQVFVADDGSPLTVGDLDAMLRNVGVDAPLEEIGTWDLATRKEVYAYVRARQEATLRGDTTTIIEEPDVLLDVWFNDVDDLLERELSEDEIEGFLTAGPWRLEQADPSNPGNDDWRIRKAVTTREGTEVVTVVTDHPQLYGQLDRARLVTANLNAIERGLRQFDENARAADQATMLSMGAAAPRDRQVDAAIADADARGAEGDDRAEADAVAAENAVPAGVTEAEAGDGDSGDVVAITKLSRRQRIS